jgi:hypothetical protein
MRWIDRRSAIAFPTATALVANVDAIDEQMDHIVTAER